MAWEYGPMAAGARSLLMTALLLMMLSFSLPTRRSISDATDLADVGQVADALDDACQMHTVANRQGQVNDGEACVTLLDADAFDIGFGIGNQAGEFGHQAAATLDFDTQGCGEILAGLVGPLQGEELVGVALELIEITTFGAVHHDALAH